LAPISPQPISGTVLCVGENARAIGGASAEVRFAAADLARRTEQQAASVKEQSVSLHGINQTDRGAPLAEPVDATDLKSLGPWPCRFESGRGTICFRRDNTNITPFRSLCTIHPIWVPQ
jgi:hypothetical protein